MHARSLGVVSERAFRFNASDDYTFSHQPSAQWPAHNGTYARLSKQGEESVHRLLIEEMEPSFTLETILESDDGDHVEHLRVALVGPADSLNGQYVIIIS